MVNAIIDAALSHARTILLLMLLILLAGGAAYSAIPKEAEPDIQIPIIYISLHLEGISPEDSERLLIRPIEKHLSAIEGVKEMSSNAYEGGGSVNLEFYAGFDSEKALADVRDKVDEARPELPQEVDEPTVHEVNLSLFPVLNVILQAAMPEKQLLMISRSLRDKIEALSQVLNVEVKGDREEALEILIDPMVLESYGLNPSDTLQLFQSNNALIAAGALDSGSGSFAIKVPGLLEDVQDFLNMPIKVGSDGSAIRLRDVAKVQRGFKDAVGYARANGTSSMVLEVSKRTGENIIETVAAVKEIVAQEQPYWPSGVVVMYSGDKSGNIKEMLANLQNNVLLAIFLVLVVILSVMGARAAGLVALSVPGSFLFGILCLSLMGVTLNIVVLFSLILSIGMLVDAGIVVSEFADRKIREGVHPKTAYGLAAKRMAWPIIASTITTLMVFLPLLYWPGIVGEFMKYMPVTLIMVLSGSLLMALVFVPTIGAWWSGFRNKQPITSEAEAEAKDSDSWDGNVDTLHPFTYRYAKALAALLNRPWVGIASVLVVLTVIVGSYIAFGKGVEFFPDIEPENLIVQVQARGNLSADERDALVQEVERAIGKIEGIRIVYASSGVFRSQNTTEDTVGVIQLELRNWRFRDSASALIKEIDYKVRDIPGIKIQVQKEQGGPAAGKPVELEFSSRTPEKLIPAVAKVLKAMEEIGGFRDVEDSRPIPAIEWRMKIDRELASIFGTDVRTAGAFLKLVTNGLIADTYRPDDADDEIDVLVRFPKEYRSLDQLDRLKVATPNGSVPISYFVTREAGATISTIQRVDQRRVLTIKADVEAGILPDVQVQKLRDYFSQNGLDPEVQVRFKGEDEDQREAQTFLSNAFLLALFGMFLILVTQFNSIYQTIVVMSAVFFSTAGVLLGLMVTAQPFGIVMCGVGVISLAGIVVNNNIIFIDSFKHMLRQGMDVKSALLHTGVQRLRPILLTAGTTVLGLIPMVFQMNIDFVTRDVSFGAPSSQWWTQLSTSIAGGLTFSTILTLFFTPSLLMMAENRKQKKLQKRLKKTAAIV